MSRAMSCALAPDRWRRHNGDKAGRGWAGHWGRRYRPRWHLSGEPAWRVAHAPRLRFSVPLLRRGRPGFEIVPRIFLPSLKSADIHRGYGACARDPRGVPPRPPARISGRQYEPSRFRLLAGTGCAPGRRDLRGGWRPMPRHTGPVPQGLGPTLALECS
jgi:hypothetical protein